MENYNDFKKFLSTLGQELFEKGTLELKIGTDGTVFSKSIMGTNFHKTFKKKHKASKELKSFVKDRLPFYCDKETFQKIYNKENLSYEFFGKKLLFIKIFDERGFELTELTLWPSKEKALEKIKCELK